MKATSKMNTKTILSAWFTVLGTVLGVIIQTALAGNIIKVSDFGDGSGSAANVQSAYNVASDGDTIQLPVGTNTWISGITIGKPVNVMGAGARQTKLVAGSSLVTSFFTITGFSSTNLVRVSGINFDMVDSSKSSRYAINVNSVQLERLRIDNNEFHYGYQQLEIGGSKGVVDHNYFYNPLKGISFTAGTSAQADESWRSMAAGTGDALFVEDNWFIYDANYRETYSQEAVGTYNGGKLVIRYNHLDSTNYVNATTITPVETHGSASGGSAIGYWQAGVGARRGQSVVEIYGNIMGGKRIDFLAILRGSANLVFSNRVDSGVSWNPRVYLREEEYSMSSNWSPLRTNWPAEDQVHNTFIWTNTVKGVPMTSTDVAIGDVSSAIMENRDYWMHAPQSSGGYEYFTGSNGASDSYPTDGIKYPTKGTMKFMADGPNAYYPYTPYVYPHPLAPPPPTVVKNFRQLN